jgi:hypothetical protein
MPDELYQCGDNGAITAIRYCDYTCTVVPGSNDYCHCQPGAPYCGTDRIVGDSKTLYRCNAGSAPPTPIMVCPNMCNIVMNANDTCS